MFLNVTNLIFGFISALASVLSIYMYFEAKRKREVEQLKTVHRQEMLFLVEKQLITLYQSTDALVQNAKARRIESEELKSSARAIRTQVHMLIENVRGERTKMDSWKFGAYNTMQPIIRKNKVNGDVTP